MRKTGCMVARSSGNPENTQIRSKMINSSSAGQMVPMQSANLEIDPNLNEVYQSYEEQYGNSSNFATNSYDFSLQNIQFNSMSTEMPQDENILAITDFPANFYELNVPPMYTQSQFSNFTGIGSNFEPNLQITQGQMDNVQNGMVLYNAEAFEPPEDLQLQICDVPSPNAVNHPSVLPAFQDLTQPDARRMQIVQPVDGKKEKNAAGAIITQSPQDSLNLLTPTFNILPNVPNFQVPLPNLDLNVPLTLTSLSPEVPPQLREIYFTQQKIQQQNAARLALQPPTGLAKYKAEAPRATKHSHPSTSSEGNSPKNKKIFTGENSALNLMDTSESERSCLRGGGQMAKTTKFISHTKS